MSALAYLLIFGVGTIAGMIHPYEILSPTSLVGIEFNLRTVGACYQPFRCVGLRVPDSCLSPPFEACWTCGSLLQGSAYRALGPAFQGWKFCVIAVDASRIWTLAEPKKDIVFEAGV
jgi:hypothetical protein